MAKATMEEVFAAIRGEKAYQVKLWGPTETRGDHSVAEFILFIEDYIAEARSLVSRNAGRPADLDALDVLRKIGALAVSCMEQNGVVTRNPDDIDTAHQRHNYLP